MLAWKKYSQSHQVNNHSHNRHFYLLWGKMNCSYCSQPAFSYKEVVDLNLPASSDLKIILPGRTQKLFICCCLDWTVILWYFIMGDFWSQMNAIKCKSPTKQTSNPPFSEGWKCQLLVVVWCWKQQFFNMLPQAKWTIKLELLFIDGLSRKRTLKTSLRHRGTCINLY